MNESVVVAGTDPEKLVRMFGDAVEVVSFDFEKPETYGAALKDVEGIFLMRPPHLGKPEDLYPFLDAVKQIPLKRIIFLSLMGVEKNTIPPHHKIEKYIESLHVPYTHIRPGFFMQNVSGIHAQEIKDQNMIFVPAGNSKTSFIDAADIGFAIATIFHAPEKHEKKAYTLTGPEALDYNQVADILSNVLGRRINYARPGYLKYRRVYIKKRELDKKYVNVTVALYFMTRMGTAKTVTTDFFELTGRQPRNFLTFAREHVHNFIR